MTAKKPLAVLTLAWSCALSFVVLVSVNCSIDHRSGEFACTKSADCDPSRSCVAGLCIVTGGGSGSDKIDAGVVQDGARIDAPGLPIDAAVCPAICTSCDPSTHSCTIDCSVDGRCVNNGPVNCPAGYFCNIDCSPAGSCRNVGCVGALGCTIACTGQGACRTTTCGAGSCDVSCSGEFSCRTVACGESCQCDVSCPVANDCQTVVCSMVVCNNQVDGGCDSNNADACHTCQP